MYVITSGSSFCCGFTHNIREDSSNYELTAGMCINNNIMLGLLATKQINFVVVKWNILFISFLHGVVYS